MAAANDGELNGDGKPVHGMDDAEWRREYVAKRDRVGMDEGRTRPRAPIPTPMLAHARQSMRACPLTGVQQRRHPPETPVQAVVDVWVVRCAAIPDHTAFKHVRTLAQSNLQRTSGGYRRRFAPLAIVAAGLAGARPG